jgi:hypothetical protein
MADYIYYVNEKHSVKFKNEKYISNYNTLSY